MTNDEIRKYFTYYMVLKDAINANKKELDIIGYRRNEKLIISEEIENFVYLVDMLKSSLHDLEVIKVFEYCYEKRLKDKETLKRVHMAPSTFYRVKEKIIQKMLCLCASEHLIIKEEILNIEIN